MGKMLGQISGYMALVVGALIAAAETRLNWDDWEDWQGFLWWGYLISVYLASALLLIGGYRTMRKQKGGLRLLSSAWGFTAGLAWLALLRASEDSAAASRFADTLPPLAIYILMSLLLLISLLGMWFTVTHQE